MILPHMILSKHPAQQAYFGGAANFTVTSG